LILAKFCEVGSTHPRESFVTSAPPPKITRENVLNRNSAVDYKISLKFCTEFKETHNTRSAIKVKGREVKIQGHSVR